MSGAILLLSPYALLMCTEITLLYCFIDIGSRFFRNYQTTRRHIAEERNLYKVQQILACGSWAGNSSWLITSVAI
jgi:hypothetical protein